jgi:uncharacterized protein
MHILISGASGLVGSHLTDFLIARGHKVGHLVRHYTDDDRTRHFQWNPAEGKMDPAAISWADAIVNLAGANVGHRWTDEYKKQILESRVAATQVLAREVKKSGKQLNAVISASAIGYYGLVTTPYIFKETDPSATDFFGTVCTQWEGAAGLFSEAGIRTVKLRLSMVLAADGGVLPKLAGPVKKRVGSPLGTGRQWMPWVHIDDLCALILRAIEDRQFVGVYNVAAPEQVTNKTFIKTIGKVLHRPVRLPRVPKFILRMVLGEMSGLVTEGSRVANEKVLEAGFRFRFEKLEDAIEDLLKIQN